MFKKPRSLGLRVWHWLNAAVIFGILGTVLVGDTLFKPRTNTPLLQQKLSAAGATVSREQAREAARMLIDRLWVWHVDLGYALAALVVLRGVVLLVERRRPAATPASGSLHYRAVKAFHRSFYVAIGVMVVTGLVLAWRDELSLPRAVDDVVGGLHENVMWFVIGFAVLHVAGVVRAELRDDAGLVSEMLHGGGGQR
jgi:Ni/Fe-hydrogenase 1 B-type cytochrome subunit